MGEVSHFKFGANRLNRSERMLVTRDRLPPNVMSSGLRDLFKYWKITDNISEMVQDTHSHNRRLIGNHMWPVERHQ